MKTRCLSCKEWTEGRSDKKFCSMYCRSNYHHQLKKDKGPSFYQSIEKQLKTNRKILAYYNRSGKATVRAEVLLDQGFNPYVITHYWRNTKGEIYLFCFEYGFRKFSSKTIQKFSLIQWQKQFMKFPGLD